MNIDDLYNDISSMEDEGENLINEEERELYNSMLNIAMLYETNREECVKAIDTHRDIFNDKINII